MRPFLTWLALGAILFLCSCQESNYTAQAYKPAALNSDTQTQLQSAEPAMSYTDEIDTFYNDDFTLSFAEDLRRFQNQARDAQKQKLQNATRLSANDLFRAITIINEPQSPELVASAQQLATHIKLSY